MRVVVSFHWRDSPPEADPVGAAQSLMRRSEALGGRVVAWHVGSVAFDFEVLDDAVELVLGERDDEGGGALPAGCSAGVVADELSVVLGAGSQVALAAGPALERATALAHVAREGEVLLDPALDDGEVLVRGARLGMFGRSRFRGLRLDLAHPWRSVVAAGVSHLQAPERVGSTHAKQLVLAPGEIAVVRGDRGSGGSRLLEDIANEHASARTLHVGPHAAGEPLGGLAFALAAARAEGVDTTGLDPVAEALLESLLGGEGLDVDAAATLIGAWLRMSPEAQGEALVVVDDARDVDADTLAAIAAAAQQEQLRVVARIGAAEELPVALAELPVSAELALAALHGAEAAALARAASGGTLGDRAAQRWGRRGRGSPLAVREAVAESIEAGDLVWDGAELVVRVRTAGRGRGENARHWVEQRLRFVEPPERALLEALAVLGGVARRADVLGLMERLEESPDDPDAVVVRLVRCRWLARRGGGQLMALPSATHRDALLDLLDPARGVELHRAAVELLIASQRPLAQSSAALHALLSGNAEQARALARRAGASAEAAGLDQSAGSLHRFADVLDLEALAERGLVGMWSSWLRVERGPLTEPAPAPASVRNAGARAELVYAMEGAGQGARAAQALRDGDLDTVDELVGQLREQGDHELVADRLAAMSALGRGDTSEALRLLRSVSERARPLAHAQRCRAALAHGIGLAAAGRLAEAVLEALEGLARAREAQDRSGERACARFLSQLSNSAEQPAAAAAWLSVAEG
jgi:hypothetical protein